MYDLIFTVVNQRRYDILAWLLEDGRHADLLSQVDDGGNTPLHLASGITSTNRQVMVTLLGKTTFTPIPADEIDHFLAGSQPIIPTLQMLVRFSDLEVMDLFLIHPKAPLKLFQDKATYDRVYTSMADDYSENSWTFRGESPLLWFSIAVECRMMLTKAMQALAKNDFNEFHHCLEQAGGDPFQVAAYLQQIIDSQVPTHPFHGTHRFTPEQLTQVRQARGRDQLTKALAQSLIIRMGYSTLVNMSSSFFNLNGISSNSSPQPFSSSASANTQTSSSASSSPSLPPS